MNDIMLKFPPKSSPTSHVFLIFPIFYSPNLLGLFRASSFEKTAAKAIEPKEISEKE